MKQLILNMSVNGSGIRDISRVLDISTDIVISVLKNGKTAYQRKPQVSKSAVPYHDIVPPDILMMGKANTQKIERKHLTFRTRGKRLARKTICYSKSPHMHKTLIGLMMNVCEFGSQLF